MKKIKNVVILLLIISNGFLLFQVYNINNTLNKTGDKPKDKEISKIVSEFETDVTKVVNEVNDKVVSIVQYKRGSVAGSGTGVVYEIEGKDNYIVTNHHVIEDAEHVVVRLASGVEVDAEVIGSDVYTDLALLKIVGEYELEAFKLGDSALSKVGEFVVAMGSPLGVEFSNSTTFGIISGKDRIVPVDLNNDGISDWDMVVLQTDAAINPGNSGGALVNMNGELIGINSLKFSSDKIEGMGFSIPINEVLPIVKQLKEDGKVNYPLLGISAIAINDLSPLYLQQLNIEEDVTGVVVVDIVLGGAAQKSGIKKNDIITSFDGVKVKDFKEFRRELYKKRPGDVVKLEVMRGQEVQEIEATLD